MPCMYYFSLVVPVQYAIFLWFYALNGCDGHSKILTKINLVNLAVLSLISKPPVFPGTFYWGQ